MKRTEIRRLKAYVVRCPNDDHCCSVVFAVSATKARQHGNGDLCDCPYIDLRARRDPDLDQYAPGPVPFRVLVENHGWHVFCTRCETALYAADNIVWRDGDYPYCQQCDGETPEATA